MAEGWIKDNCQLDDKLVCDLCDTKTDQQLSKCLDCNMYICGRCTTAHERVPVTEHYKIVTGIERSKLQNLSRMCKIHKHELILCHCTPCNELICLECILGDHKGHDGVKFKDFANQKRREMKVKLQQAKNVQKSEIAKIINKIEEKEKENDNNAKDTENKIQIRKTQIITEVDKVFKGVREQNRKIHQQNQDKLGAVKEQVTQCSPEYIKQYMELLHIGADMEVVMAEEEMYLNLDSVPHVDADIDIQINKSCVVFGKIDTKILESLCGSVQSYHASSPNFKPNPGLSTDVFHQVESSPGFPFTPQFFPADLKPPFEKEIGPSSDVSYHAKSSPGKKFQPKSISADLKVPSGTDISSSDVPLNTQVITLFSEKSEQVRSICPLSDDTAIINYFDSYNYDIASINGQIEKTLDFKVNDIIMTSQGSLIAADGQRPSLHKLTKDCVMVQTVNTAPLIPVGLCEARDGNLLVTMVDKPSHTVDNSSIRLVSKLTMDGTSLERFEHQNGSRLFTWPHGVSENISGDICVVDVTGVSSGHLVAIDNKGKIKYKYEGMRLRYPFDPVQVKCDKFGYVIVNDRRNIKIHMLDIDGRFIRYIVDGDDLKESKFPCSLALEKDGVLWVGCVEGTVYKLKYLK